MLRVSTQILRPAAAMNEYVFCNIQHLGNKDPKRAVCTSQQCTLGSNVRVSAWPSSIARQFINIRATSSTATMESPPKARKVTTLSLASKKRRGHKITMVTAYDYPSAVHVDRAGIDVILVGDSCAMVELGFETTQVS